MKYKHFKQALLFKVGSDVNLPRENSLEKCLEIFKKPLDKRQNDLLDYITESSNAFINEPDDKTILLGRK